ncbi:alpha-L-fucosidase [Bauldia sp.]|uniref:alpha-L-fucosidase n=1 Tax=Bauldia sp. TaxID=2575872 RepID=UPI003BA9BB17
MTEPYTPDWSSLRRHQTPQWLRDGKFGIYTHWGPYSVPGIGPNVSWYPHNMYRPGTAQHAAHAAEYGDPSEFGYKDFIPLFTADKFDPDEWADLFHGAGARFAGPVAEHHDGFPLWDTKFGEWNAAKQGPKRDIVRDLEVAFRAKGMKYMVAMHHAENWWFYPHWIKGTDTSDPRFADLYGEIHNTDIRHVSEDWDDHNILTRQKEWTSQDMPNKAFLDRWMARLKELVDEYGPDYIWFDFGLAAVPDSYKKNFLSYYYNKEHEWDREVMISYKAHNLPPGTGLVDFELGGMSQQTYFEWITDTTIDDGSGWGYMREENFKTARDLIHYLVDNVSKNGNMLLNVGPRPDGTIPDGAKETLRGIGRWLEVNGEAIYDTTPWHRYGEGPTRMTTEGHFADTKEKVRYTCDDFRFTTKGNAIYAIAMEEPRPNFTIEAFAEKRRQHESFGFNSFTGFYPSQIQSVQMLGVDGELSWRLTDRGLNIDRPEKLPCEHAFAIRVSCRDDL